MVLVMVLVTAMRNHNGYMVRTRGVVISHIFGMQDISHSFDSFRRIGATVPVMHQNAKIIHICMFISLNSYICMYISLNIYTFIRFRLHYYNIYRLRYCVLIHPF